ncbi:MAG: NAD(+)/NADH kinase [Anaerolineae bacterium]|nr:NAD(+)/NADH kinase [Anaerolineae bacterium]
MIKRAGILGHPLRPDTGAVCSDVAHSLRARGVEAWCEAVWDAASIAARVADSDLIVAIGGDGAMLRAARVCARAGVPVLGINAGHLGFLTETSLAEWETALDGLLAGDYWTEERMMITAEAWRGETRLCVEDALNDVVVGRGLAAKAILLEMYIDGGWTTDYNADGLIIATPTGSTAYALAVGGPILPPTLGNILVVPVAPHLSLDRPLVLDEGATVEIVVSDLLASDAVLTVDGETLTELHSGDEIVVSASKLTSRFIRLRDRNYFYRSLLDRMEPRLPARAQQAREPRRTVRKPS